MILKRYKNELFFYIKESKYGLDAFNFVEDDKTLTINFKNIPFRFIIESNPKDNHSFGYSYTKFLKDFPLDESLIHWVQFEQTLTVFHNWLQGDVQDYISEQNEIDLLDEYQKGQTILNIQDVDFDDKTNFGNDEKIQIKLAINDLKLLIHQQFEITEPEQEAVIARLDYLIEASNRLNKFDWKSLAINTIISISITLSLDTEKGRQLFELFKKVFKIIPQIFLQN